MRWVRRAGVLRVLLDTPRTSPSTMRSGIALRRQIHGHLKNHQGLVLVVAYERGTAVGFGYAFPCSAEHWFGLT